MPLVPCPECGRQISTAAEACPQCGHPQALQESREDSADANPFAFNQKGAKPRVKPQGSDPFAFIQGTPQPAAVQCYCCGSLATTKCVNCGQLSCAVHLQPITITRGDDRSRELRCTTCYEQAKKIQKIGCIIAAVIGVIMLFMIVANFGWLFWR